MDFSLIIQRLNELTTFMNNVRTLSKKIFQLPPSTEGVKWVAVYNDTSEETEKLNLTEALDGMYSLTNGITAIGNITRDGADFTFEVGFEWKINGIEYANAEITRIINDAGTGNHRIDIAVCDTNNDIYIVEGFEVPLATAVVQPPTPPNTFFICSFLISESVIGDNSTPELVGQNNIPLKIEIESTDLDTNDVAGFVDYVNALNPPLTVLETNSLVQYYLTDTKDVYQFVGVGKGVYGLDNLQITSANVFKFSVADSTTPTLPQVLAQGDRTIRLSDGDGETILELNDQGKLLYNQDGDFLMLPADLYPVNTVLKIHNIGTAELYCIPDVDNNPSISINGANIDEFTPIVLQPGTAVLKKVNGDSFSETWILTYEVLDFSREALGLNLVDNTPDNSKPVSTAQATAIANAQSTAQTYAKNYTDNIRLKQPARLAVDTNVTSLSGQQTFHGITVSTGDIILLMAQTNQKENGLWLVNGLGAWTRPEDFRNGLDVSFVIIPVLGGTYRGRFFGTGAGRIVGDATGNGNITIQEIKYFLNGISFADGTDITEANNLLEALGKLQKQLTDVRAAKQDKTTVFKNTTQTVVTGTTGEVIIYAEEVLANTISNNTILSFRSRNYRNPRVGTCIYRLYINTVNNLTGSPVQISRLDLSANQGSNPIERHYLIKDNTLRGYQFNVSTITDVASGNVDQSTTTYNINTTYYWILTAQPNTSSDSLTHSFSILERI